MIGSVSFVLQRDMYPFEVHSLPAFGLTATRVNKQYIREPHQS